MSGIYIPNIEQPEYCAKCFAFDAETCECNLGVKRTCNPFDGRYDHCTVFPVPDHGRLGDLDVLSERVEKSRLNNTHTNPLTKSCHDHEHDHFQFMIANAPTIIPTDKEERNA